MPCWNALMPSAMTRTVFDGCPAPCGSTRRGSLEARRQVAEGGVEGVAGHAREAAPSRLVVTGDRSICACCRLMTQRIQPSPLLLRVLDSAVGLEEHEGELVELPGHLGRSTVVSSQRSTMLSMKALIVLRLTAVSFCPCVPLLHFAKRRRGPARRLAGCHLLRRTGGLAGVDHGTELLQQNCMARPTQVVGLQ